MFNWFKSADRKKADEVLALLTRAIKEVHPNRFVDPAEAALFTQPKLSQLNLLLCKDERFAAVDFDHLVAMTSDYERKGYAKELGGAIAHDPVLIALVIAATYERHGRAMRVEVRKRAKLLLDCVNAYTSPTA
jgi:hypothetical protein